MIWDLLPYLCAFFISAFLLMLFQKMFLCGNIIGLEKHIILRNVLYCFVCCMCLFPVVGMYGLRYGIGPDYFTYESIFYTIKDASFEEYIQYHYKGYGAYYVELGYYLLNRIFHSFRYLQWGIAVLVFSTICLALKKYKQRLNFGFAILIYLLSQFFYLMDTTRFAISLAFVLLAYCELVEEHIFKFLLFVVIAVTFHKTAIICLFMFFMKEFKSNLLNKIRDIIVIVGVVALPIFATALLRFASNLHIFERYFSTDVYSLNNEYGYRLTFFLHVIPYAVPLLVFCRKELLNNNTTKTLFRISLLEIPLRFVGSFNTWFTRVSRFAQISQVLLLPLVLTSINDKRKRLLYIYYLIWYIFDFGYYEIVNGSAFSLPYVSVFSN